MRARCKPLPSRFAELNYAEALFFDSQKEKRVKYEARLNSKRLTQSACDARELAKLGH